MYIVCLALNQNQLDKTTSISLALFDVNV